MGFVGTAVDRIANTALKFDKASMRIHATVDGIFIGYLFALIMMNIHAIWRQGKVRNTYNAGLP